MDRVRDRPADEVRAMTQEAFVQALRDAAHEPECLAVAEPLVGPRSGWASGWARVYFQPPS